MPAVEVHYQFQRLVAVVGKNRKRRRKLLSISEN
jgi:hypothetical protein